MFFFLLIPSPNLGFETEAFRVFGERRNRDGHHNTVSPRSPAPRTHYKRELGRVHASNFFWSDAIAVGPLTY